MLFNLLRGHNPGLGVISGTVTGITGPKIIQIPITVQPIMAVFRTTVGNSSEMAVYYRAELGAELTLVTGGSAPVNSRLYYEMDVRMAVLVDGASTANTAAFEYYILGVKKE
ncbi:MAG: hypothetical protein IJN08_00150 [Clostridia bacterium]|nr:hypothetical protein [Clostridia bacterium]